MLHSRNYFLDIYAIYSYAMHFMWAPMIPHLKAGQCFCHICIEQRIFKIMQCIYLCILLFLSLHRFTNVFNLYKYIWRVKCWRADIMKKAPCCVSEQISKQKGSLLGCFDSASTQNNLQQAVCVNKILDMKELNSLKN